MNAAISHRWGVLAVVIGGQFMFVVDAFIVNVAIPSIRADLTMSAAGIEAVIASIAFGNPGINADLARR